MGAIFLLFPFLWHIRTFFILSSFTTYSCKLLGRMTKTTHQEVLQSPSQKKKSNIKESRSIGKCLVTSGGGYTGSSTDDSKFNHHPFDTSLSEATGGTRSWAAEQKEPSARVPTWNGYALPHYKLRHRVVIVIILRMPIVYRMFTTSRNW